MLPRVLHSTTPRLLLGLAICSILFVGTAFVSEATPLMQTAPMLGAASSFAVLGGSTVTNTGATTVRGDLGVSPGSAVTGFPPGTVVGGTIHAADAVAGQAQSDTTTAYNSLAGQPCTADLTGQDLGGKTLTAGVYCFSTSAQLTGALTLNAQGNANAVFIFKIGSTLTTASGSTVLLINGGSPCSVFWQVGSSATVGTTTTFVGNILALTSITLNTGAGVSGRALARNGAVTMDTNNIGSAGCAAGLATATPTATATAVATATPTSAPASAPPPPKPAATAVLAPASAATAVLAPASAATATASPATATVAPATAPAITAATSTAVMAATATTITAATATAITAATATALATPSPVTQPAGLAATSTPSIAVAPAAAAATPAGAAGRAGGLDPVAVAAGLALLGALALGAGLLRRRRLSG